MGVLTTLEDSSSPKTTENDWSRWCLFTVKLIVWCWRFPNEASNLIPFFSCKCAFVFVYDVFGMVRSPWPWDIVWWEGTSDAYNNRYLNFSAPRHHYSGIELVFCISAHNTFQRSTLAEEIHTSCIPDESALHLRIHLNSKCNIRWIEWTVRKLFECRSEEISLCAVNFVVCVSLCELDKNGQNRRLDIITPPAEHAFFSGWWSE